MRKQRITISLEPADYEVLKRLAVANGDSMSSIVSELVSSVAPSLAKVAEIVELASSAQGDLLDHLRTVTERSEALLSPVMLSAAAGLDEASAEMLEALRPPSV